MNVTTLGSSACSFMRLNPILRRPKDNDPIHGPKRVGGRGLHPSQAPGSLESGGGPYPKTPRLEQTALLR